MKLLWIRKIRMQGSFFVFIFTTSNICTKILKEQMFCLKNME